MTNAKKYYSEVNKWAKIGADAYKERTGKEPSEIRNIPMSEIVARQEAVEAARREVKRFKNKIKNLKRKARKVVRLSSELNMKG